MSEINYISGQEFVNLCKSHGFKNYQQIADNFNDGKVDTINKWGNGSSVPPMITRIGLYAIAKYNGWL
jgi:hypothetical protein